MLRRSPVRFIGGLSAALLLTGTVAWADYATTIDAGSDWGTWEGWGASLCWWANVFGQRDDIADILFTTNLVAFNGQVLPGLGLNIARYNAGAGSSASINGETMQVSPTIPAHRRMSGYWLNWFSADPSSASWDWTVDANQRAMLLKARARGANQFELFSNSPMWWMCYNHNPSGSANGGSDNLQSWNYQAHAAYLATVAKYALDHWGIAFTSVEPFNEPSANWWTSGNNQEGCHFDRSTQATVVGNLRTALDAQGLASTRVAASDENSYDAARATWGSFDATTRGQVGQVNTHGYQYGGGRRDLLFQDVAGKKLWNSEYGEGDASGLSMAGNLNLEFRWLHPTAWCYWQPLDSGGWGLIASNPGDHWIGAANPKYYVLAQFSRHLRPGMILLDSGSGDSVAAYDRTNHLLVVVTTGYGSTEWITLDLSRFAHAGGPVRRWRTQTGAGDKYRPYSDLSVTNDSVRVFFPSNTVQTLEIQNVFLTAPDSPSRLAADPGFQQVALRWSAVAGTDDYRIERAVDPGTNFQAVATTAATNFIDTAVAAGTRYGYRLAARNKAGTSPPSLPVTAVPFGPPQLALVQGADGSSTFSWPVAEPAPALFSATNLAAPILWRPILETPATSNGFHWLTVPTTGSAARFFRLQPL